jgi:hypothetical protein
MGLFVLSCYPWQRRGLASLPWELAAAPVAIDPALPALPTATSNTAGAGAGYVLPDGSVRIAVPR